MKALGIHRLQSAFTCNCVNPGVFKAQNSSNFFFLFPTYTPRKSGPKLSIHYLYTCILIPHLLLYHRHLQHSYLSLTSSHIYVIDHYSPSLAATLHIKTFFFQSSKRHPPSTLAHHKNAHINISPPREQGLILPPPPPSHFRAIFHSAGFYSNDDLRTPT